MWFVECECCGYNASYFIGLPLHILHINGQWWDYWDSKTVDVINSLYTIIQFGIGINKNDKIHIICIGANSV